MSPFFQTLLVLHVLLGLGGVIAFGVLWLALERGQPPVKSLRRDSLTGLLMLIGSWLIGGYYYVKYYGAAVKPVIKVGAYPWAHTLVMELKEHIFLFLPFLALAVTLMVWTMGDRLDRQPALKSGLAKLVGVIVTIGSVMALMGVIISGAAR